MTDEELIKEAYVRYPVGTVFHSVSGNAGVTIKEGNEFRIEESLIKGSKLSRELEPNCKGSVYAFSDKKWAEIISSPRKEVNNEYSIY